MKVRLVLLILSIAIVVLATPFTQKIASGEIDRWLGAGLLCIRQLALVSAVFLLVTIKGDKK